MYPNPAQDVLNLVMPATQRGTTLVEPVDAGGKVCRTLKTETTWTPVSVGDLRNGTYAVRLTLPDGTRTTRTVVVSH